MFEKILVAFDGSPSSENALDTALVIAKKFGSVINLVTVVAQSDFAALKNETNDMSKEETEFYRELQEKAVESRKWVVEINPIIIYGHPSDRILDYAKCKKSDLLVMGSRGLSNTERFFLGSVSDELSHHSPCPLLIVH